MSSSRYSSCPSLSDPEHCDGLGRDDELWIQYVSITADADKRMIDESMKLIDTILVFDALFIGVLSAFILSPGNGLQRDPAAISNDLLVAIYNQLSNSSERRVDPNSFFNMTPNQQKSIHDTNMLLYPSLALSIMTSLLATSAKMWLLRYSRRVASPGTPYERAIRRQEAYDGAVAWRLKEIIELLPLLVALAVVMFALYIRLSIIDDARLTFTTGMIFLSCLLLILIASIFGAFFPTAPFQSPISDLIRFIFKIFDYPFKCPNFLRISLMISVSVATAVMAAFYVITQTSTRYLAYLTIPVACATALATPHPERNDEMKPRIYGLPEWGLFFGFTTFAMLVLSASIYVIHDHPTPFIISFCFGCVLIALVGYCMIQISKFAPDTTTAEAVTSLLMNSTSQNPAWLEKAAKIGSTDVKRAVLLGNLLPLLTPLITSIPDHDKHATLKPDQVAYITCLGKLCHYTPSPGSFWRNEVAFPRPIFSRDLAEKLQQLLDCPHCPQEVRDHVNQALQFSVPVGEKSVDV